MVQGLVKRRKSRRLFLCKSGGIPIEAMRCLVSEEGMVIDGAVPIMQMKEG